MIVNRIANSNFQSLTNSTGVNANANLFTGSRFPAFASYNYADNSSGILGLTGAPNFTTVGTTQAFGLGWSALLQKLANVRHQLFARDWKWGTYTYQSRNEFLTRTLNLRSTYEFAGWRLSGQYQYLKIDSTIPTFLSGGQGNTFSDSSGNNIGLVVIQNLPWHGSVGLTFSHSNYLGNFGSTLEQQNGVTDYTTNMETINTSFAQRRNWGSL